MVIKALLDRTRLDTSVIKRLNADISALARFDRPVVTCVPGGIVTPRRHCQEGNARPLDFGMAAIQYARSRSDSASGLSGMIHLASEQLTSDTCAPRLTDCELLTGNVPDSLRNPVAGNAGRRTGLGQLRPDIPADAEPALLKATSFPPDDRPFSARELSEESWRVL